MCHPRESRTESTESTTEAIAHGSSDERLANEGDASREREGIVARARLRLASILDTFRNDGERDPPEPPMGMRGETGREKRSEERDRRNESAELADG